MSDKIFTKLLPKTWPLLVAVLVIGGIVGKLIQSVYGSELFGFEIVLALYSVGFVWAGLVVGYSIKSK